MCAISEGFVCSRTRTLRTTQRHEHRAWRVTEFCYFIFIMCTNSTFGLAVRMRAFDAYILFTSVRITISHVFVFVCTHDYVRLNSRHTSHHEPEKPISNVAFSQLAYDDCVWPLHICIYSKTIKTIPYLLFKCDWTLSRARYAIFHHASTQRNSTKYRAFANLCKCENIVSGANACAPHFLRKFMHLNYFILFIEKP